MEKGCQIKAILVHGSLLSTIGSILSGLEGHLNWIFVAVLRL
jgi:hypothetical protein